MKKIKVIFILTSPFIHNRGIMFYTESNGQLPLFCNTALHMLGIFMEWTPLDETDFEKFQEVAPVIDSKELDLFL